MAKEIIWSPKAAEGLVEICDYIAKDSHHYAEIFAKKIFTIIDSAAHFPMSGRIVPEYDNENIREKFYQNYRIVFRIKGNAIEIVAIVHGARILKDLF